MTTPETTSELTKLNKESNKLIEISLDATMLDTFVSCPAKFNYRFNMNKSSLEKPAPLDKGGLIHVGKEAYYLALKEKLSFSEALELAVNAFNQSTVESDLDPSDITFLRKVLIENLTYWKQTDLNMEILEVESSFAYELFVDEVIRITMIGKIDLLYKDTKLGIVPQDTKTYQRDYPVYRRKNQFCNYAYATGSSYLIVDRVGLQTSLPPDKKHKRKPLSYDPLFLEQWKQNVVKWCYWYLECASTNVWPMNDTSCDKFGRLCEYDPICDSSGTEAKIYKLNTDFRSVDKWDVARSLGLEK